MRLGSTSVRIHKDFKGVYDRLSQDITGRNDYHPAFSQHTHAFTFMACLGFNHSQKKELEKPGELFKAHYLSRDEEVILTSIALLSSSESPTNLDISVLDDPKHVIRIAEEYAHAGIFIFFKEILGFTITAEDAAERFNEIPTKLLEEIPKDVLHFVINERRSAI